MATVQKTPRSRKPLLPVQVDAELTCGCDDPGSDLVAGSAILTIVSGDESDRDTRNYWTRFLFDRGIPYAVELVRFGDAEKRIVTLVDERCDCQDATYRPDRPGGCKHVVALRQTLPAVAEEGKVVAA